MKNKALAWLLVGWAAGSTAVAQHYLPTAGPNPFRFQPVAPISLPPGLLPAPGPKAAPASEPAPAVAMESGPAEAVPPEILELPEPVDPRTPLLTQRPATESPSIPIRRGAPSLTPQMLLHYFHEQGGTNGPVVSLPVSFNPPVPEPSGPSSRASYRTPPGPVPGPGTPPPSP